MVLVLPGRAFSTLFLMFEATKKTPGLIIQSIKRQSNIVGDLTNCTLWHIPYFCLILEIVEEYVLLKIPLLWKPYCIDQGWVLFYHPLEKGV